MPLLPRLLLVPLLAPLLVVLLVAALNPRPAVSLRLLTWSSPALPLGLWLALAGAGGAALSGAATALALGQGAEPLQRTVRRERPRSEPWPDRWGEEPQERPVPPRATAGPARAAGEPAPTVSVPFRVIRRGPPSAATSGFSPSGDTPAAATTPVASGGGWEQPLADDW